MTERSIQRILFLRHMSAQLILPNHTPLGWYECDLWVVSVLGYSIEYEIKLDIADFFADKRKVRKHERLHDRDAGVPNRFFYVVPKGLVQTRDLPGYAGLVYVDRGVLFFVRPAPRLSTDKVSTASMQHTGTRGCRRYCWRVLCSCSDTEATQRIFDD